MAINALSAYSNQQEYTDMSKAEALSKKEIRHALAV
jgi:hypothetical protein